MVATFEPATDTEAGPVAAGGPGIVGVGVDGCGNYGGWRRGCQHGRGLGSCRPQQADLRRSLPGELAGRIGGLHTLQKADGGRLLVRVAELCKRIARQ